MSSEKKIIKPSFFVVGAQKAGTTTFYEIFKNHPEVYLPQKKETRFFSHHYNKGLSWYLNNFFTVNISNTFSISGETDPGYMDNSEIPEKIHSLLGQDIKIIMLVRQPVKRAYSAYNMYKKFNQNTFKEWTKYNFSDHLEKEFKGEIESNYIKWSKYHQSYSNYKEIFGSENVKLIIFEDFISDKKNKIINDICSFLNISTDFNFDTDQHANKGNLPRHSVLNFIYGSNFFVKTIRSYINSHQNIKVFVKKIFTKPVNRLSKDDIDNYTNKYFEEDILNLEKELGHKITKWK
ncbi:sulfotransferase [Tamlana haliotis]|uniref:Sulfotransferase n=1 Tax=Pseudotamlana haliotis TaxID=2614804 RepID=A0A6N6MI60_9FLAO|nr:sulfotransferase [Tamlana haliotis]KAB1067857.1 sulfotransferase [Tamlana haliotis]